MVTANRRCSMRLTWALWGETRAKSLDDVVRLGQDEAEVEFSVDLENERYRVLRKRSLKTRRSLWSSRALIKPRSAIAP